MTKLTPQNDSWRERFEKEFMVAGGWLDHERYEDVVKFIQSEIDRAVAEAYDKGKFERRENDKDLSDLLKEEREEGFREGWREGQKKPIY